jgi:hypothetical protein
MKLFPRLTVGEGQHGDIRDCIDPETWKPYQSPILTTSTALRECCRIPTSNGRCLNVLRLFTLRNRTTTIALDMLGHYALTDKVFETPGWSKVVIVEPTGMKPVKLIGVGGATFAPGKGDRRIQSHNSYKTGEIEHD